MRRPSPLRKSLPPPRKPGRSEGRAERLEGFTLFRRALASRACPRGEGRCRPAPASAPAASRPPGDAAWGLAWDSAGASVRNPGPGLMGPLDNLRQVPTYPRSFPPTARGTGGPQLRGKPTRRPDHPHTTPEMGEEQAGHQAGRQELVKTDTHPRLGLSLSHPAQGSSHPQLQFPGPPPQPLPSRHKPKGGDGVGSQPGTQET